MTFIFCAALGVDLQQISIAALIIALGLLVDDPVVAGDAINRELADGTRDVAAWLKKLSRAILYATITNAWRSSRCWPARAWSASTSGRCRWW